MLNRVFLMGRLTKDPELRRTQAGNAVTSFSLAVERDYKGANGEKETDFFDVVAWRSTAEFISKYFTKGRMVVVEGSLQVRGWVDKEGNKRRSVEVLAQNAYFADSAKNNNNAAPAASEGNPTLYSMPPVGNDEYDRFTDEEDDGDLPF